MFLTLPDMKLAYLPFFALITLFYNNPPDVIDKVADQLAKGSVHELAKLFAAEVELVLPGTEDNTYKKAEAEVMLAKFFNQNKPVSVKVLHRINTAAGYQFGVVELGTNKGIFRVSANFKNENGSLLLVKLMIEPERVR